MKKHIVVLVFIVFVSSLLCAKDKFFASVGAAGAWPLDSGFREYYGSVQFSPELKVGFTFLKGFYAWLGYSFFSASYTIPDLEEKTSASQHFVALGVGWESSRKRRLRLDAFVAMLLAGLREKGLGETVMEFAPGIQAGAGIRYIVSKKIFLATVLSFSAARIVLPEDENSMGGERFMGGARLHVSVGTRF